MGNKKHVNNPTADINDIMSASAASKKALLEKSFAAINHKLFTNAPSLSIAVHDPNNPDYDRVFTYAVNSWSQFKGARWILMHKKVDCEGRPCVFHGPSNHIMIMWPTVYHADTQSTNRMCPHGVEHPDPDDMIYQRMKGKHWKANHRCDNCCDPLYTEEEKW